MSVKLELYRVFKEVAEAGNITAAAQALYISQSAVSQSIKQLEGELQTRLFARNSRGVALTPDGRMLYEYVRSAIGLLDMPAWALRFMGQTEQGMQTMLRRIPDHISLESVRATWEAGLYLYRTDFPVQPGAKVACWYGEKEGHMKKAIQRLRKAYPGLIVRCFPGFGHGEIINHPALLASELERFLTDGGTEGDALQNQESEIQ